MSIDILLELFAGNTAVYGTEEGGCVKHADDYPGMPQAKWWADRVECHFDGASEPCGVYPMVSEYSSLIHDIWVVKWGCIDFDEGDTDSLVHARNVVGVLAHFDIVSWIEKSRSKGYHVWIFLTEWTEAASVRRALLGACQIANAPTKEINPKQEMLAEGQVGNYVRLPYPGNNPGEATNNRMVIVETIDANNNNPWLPLDRDDFARAAHASRVDATRLETLGKLWQPPILNVSATFGSTGPPPSRPAEKRLSGLAWTMWRDGMMAGQDDRSSWLWSFARELVKCDVTSSEAREFLYQGHDHHAAKWADRADAGRPQLDRMLAKASGAP